MSRDSLSKNNIEAPVGGSNWTAHLIGASLAATMVFMVYTVSLAMQRTPPFVRIAGNLVPDRVYPGDYVQVRYVVTKRLFDNRTCPGTLQQEIVDSQLNIISKAVRETGPAKWEDHPTNPNLEIFYGHPVQIPTQLQPGPAVFRTATFRICNWVQYLLRWPIYQIGPDLPFVILEPGPPETKPRQ